VSTKDKSGALGKSHRATPIEYNSRLHVVLVPVHNLRVPLFSSHFSAQRAPNSMFTNTLLLLVAALACSGAVRANLAARADADDMQSSLSTL